MKLSKSSLKEVGEGVVERAVDVVLALIYFNLEAPSLIRSKRYKIEEKVNEDFENLDYQKIKRALIYLRGRGLINILKDKSTLPAITQSGEKRLKSILPFYDEKRIWDGKVYLITYDIPEAKKGIRDSLRNYLKKIGCGMLQQSVWITPYNPTSHVRKFSEEHELGEGMILISSMGKNGTIGQLTLPNLMENVFKLNSINQKYLEFISISNEEKLKRPQLIFQFLLILKDDPQLPFQLLPDYWAGEKAYKIFKEITNTNAAA